jgi:hypothetical protein
MHAMNNQFTFAPRYMTALKRTRLEFLVTGTAVKFDVAVDTVLAVGRFLLKTGDTYTYGWLCKVPHRANIKSFWRVWSNLYNDKEGTSPYQIINKDSNSGSTARSLARCWYVAFFPVVFCPNRFRVCEHTPAADLSMVQFWIHMREDVTIHRWHTPTC